MGKEVRMKIGDEVQTDDGEDGVVVSLADWRRWRNRDNLSRGRAVAKANRAKERERRKNAVPAGALEPAGGGENLGE